MYVALDPGPGFLVRFSNLSSSENVYMNYCMGGLMQLPGSDVTSSLIVLHCYMYIHEQSYKNVGGIADN
jgi:hypothetical protein